MNLCAPMRPKNLDRWVVNLKLNIAVTIIITIVVFGVLIFIHELGHFLVAKAMGIRVNEFALGMGPRLCGFVKGETKYSLRLLPIGGYCAMEGEDDTSEDERAFCNKPVWRRILVVAAGAFMNLVLGFVLLIILVSTMNLVGTTKIAQFNEGAISNQYLQVGDEIVSINGSHVFIDNDIVYGLLSDRDGVVDMVVKRNGEKVKLTGVTFQTEDLGDGVTGTNIDFKVYGVEKTFFGVIKQSACWTLSVVKLVWGSLIDLLTGQFGLNQLSGPVGVASAIGEASTMGIRSLLLFVVFITVNLGVFNLLPIPALDGGRLVFLIVEGIRRKPIKPEHEGWVHMIGFGLLMLLIVVVTFNDIVKLFH